MKNDIIDYTILTDDLTFVNETILTHHLIKCSLGISKLTAKEIEKLIKNNKDIILS